MVQKKNNSYIDLYSSIIATTLTYPIDVIKTQYQVNSINYGVATKLIKLNKYSVPKLNPIFKPSFRGLSPHLMTYPLFWTSFFYTKNEIKKYTSSNVLASFSAACICSTLTNPFFVFKIRTQTEILRKEGKISYPKLFNNIRKKEGSRSFFKGLGATWMNNTKTGFTIPLYEYMKEKEYNAFQAGLVSKVGISLLFYPFDIIRNNQRESIKKVSILGIGRKIFYKEGLLGFYKGVSLYTATTAPNFILMMVLKDKLEGTSIDNLKEWIKFIGFL